jgi:hypothetical protein
VCWIEKPANGDQPYRDRYRRALDDHADAEGEQRDQAEYGSTAENRPQHRLARQVGVGVAGGDEAVAALEWSSDEEGREGGAGADGGRADPDHGRLRDQDP